MATDLETRPAKHVAFVEQQVNKVQRKIRSLDIGRSLLWLGVVVLGYGLLMGVLDLTFKGAESGLLPMLRWVLFGGFAVSVVYFLGQAVVRFWRRINPYFAARELERTLPNAKNSVINYLDLRDEELPPVILGAVGQRAAKDLKGADPDKAVNPKPNLLLGGILVGLVLGLLILLATSPNQFPSLMRRAFIPFQEARLDTSARIQLLEPATEIDGQMVPGHVMVALNQRVSFRAKLSGRFPPMNHPQGPRLLYRYNQSDNFVEQPLEEDNDGTWTTVRLGDQVQNGFWYKLAAGDAETPEYQVKVRSLPQASRFEVTYKFRPYRKLRDETIRFPNDHAVFPRIQGHRGTEVTVVVHTNRNLKEGECRLELEFPKEGGKKDIFGEFVKDEKNPASAFSCKWTLEKPGHFRVFFKSQEGEENTDRSAYTMEVLEDQTPEVILTKPGLDVELPANGTLDVEGFARDDFGVKRLALNFKIAEGAIPHDIAPQPYRPKKKLEFDDGGFPNRIDFKDLILLDKLKTTEGKDLILGPGAVLEYWLEAIDNADLNKTGNIGTSDKYKIKILANQDPKKQQEERKKAEDDKNKHDQKQDQDHARQNEDRKNPQKNNGEQPKEQDPKAKAEQDQREKDLQDRANELKDQLDKQERDEQKGQGKGQEGPQAQNKQGGTDKDAPQADAKDNKPPEPKDAGNQKNAGDKQDGQNAGQARDGGAKQDPKENDPGQARGQGEQPPQPQAKDAKDSGDPKNGPQPQAKKNEPGQQQNPGQAKEGGGQDGMKPQPAQAKENGPQNKGQEPQAKKQEGPKDGAAPQAKQDGGKMDPNAQPGQCKNGGDQPGGEGQQPQAKNNPGQADQPGNQGQPKPGAQAQPGNPMADAKGDQGQKQPGTAKAGEKDAKAGAAPDAHAKNNPGMGEKGNQAAAKDGGKDQAQNAAQSRDDPQARRPEQPKEPTAEDLARLKKWLDNASPEDIARLKEQLKRLEQAEDAAQDLSRLAKDAKDPKVRQAAEEALAKDGRPKDGPGRNKNNDGPDAKMPPQAKQGEPKDGMGQQAGQPREGDAQEGQNAGKGKEGEPKQAGNSQGGNKAGHWGPGGGGMTDNIKAMDPNADFTRRGGNLQLDDLKKRGTPEARKKAGITDEQWQQFMNAAQAHERWLQQNQASAAKVDRQKELGTTSKLPAAGVRQVGGAPTTVDPLTGGRALPPPEFREPQRIFTNRPQPKP